MQDKSTVVDTKNEKQVKNQNPEMVLECFKQAAKMLSPLWDTRDYVAVNPFFGFKEKPFLNAIKYIKESSGLEMLPSNEFFLKKFTSGEITDYDLELAIKLYDKEVKQSTTPRFESKQLIDCIKKPKPKPSALHIRCLSDLYDIQNSACMTETITNEVSKWASAYFDEGQAAWKIPNREFRFYHCWKSLCQYDASTKNITPSFVKLVTSLPHDPIDALNYLTNKLFSRVRLNQSETTDYFYRLIFTTMGWSSYIQKFEFEATRSGDDSNLTKIGGLIDIFVIRLAYDISLLKDSIDLNLLKRTSSTAKESSNIEYKYIWLLATEAAYRRQVTASLSHAAFNEEVTSTPLAQAVFCIDVRSEVIRRHIELQSNSIQTIGFAGFFGMLTSIKGLGHQASDQQCPVLLEPALEIAETSNQSKNALEKARQVFVDKKHLVRKIQSSTNSCFSFVETLGFTYIYKLIQSSFGSKKPNIDVSVMGLSTKELQSLHLDLSTIDLETKASMAYGALKNMGLIKNFSRYVFFFGHGSESSNNPYASALDCGACAGHSGHGNSKLLASILNETDVRNQIRNKGIDIPENTLFLSGWHNTTKDQLLFDKINGQDEAQKIDLKKISAYFNTASMCCRKERSTKLPFAKSLEDPSLVREFNNKSNDWSEIRPEWGLAKNASFFVARRKLTRAIDLGGRAFLHDYDASEDQDLSKLELIMTAPMIVTNWINMQYYASTIEPNKFGAGNKVLNNVVGTIGCIQGNASDLLGGLTEQSVRYGGQYYHEPIRLQVYIEATTSSIDAIIKKHQLVKDLVENNWLKLIAIDPHTKETSLYHDRAWLDTKEEIWN